MSDSITGLLRRKVCPACGASQKITSDQEFEIPDDPESLAEAIKEALDEEEERQGWYGNHCPDHAHSARAWDAALYNADLAEDR